MDFHIKFSVSYHSKQQANNFWFPIVPSKQKANGFIWDPLHRWEDNLELTGGEKKASTGTKDKKDDKTKTAVAGIWKSKRYISKIITHKIVYAVISSRILVSLEHRNCAYKITIIQFTFPAQ